MRNFFQSLDFTGFFYPKTINPALHIRPLVLGLRPLVLGPFNSMDLTLCPLVWFAKTKALTGGIAFWGGGLLTFGLRPLVFRLWLGPRDHDP